MGLLEESYRLPVVSPKAESKEKILRVLRDMQLIGLPAGKVTA
jgi:hypothetical protein